MARRHMFDGEMMDGKYVFAKFENKSLNFFTEITENLSKKFEKIPN
jgi:hypothetical protein